VSHLKLVDCVVVVLVGQGGCRWRSWGCVAGARLSMVDAGGWWSWFGGRGLSAGGGDGGRVKVELSFPFPSDMGGRL
jgi:hypothetical protein